MFNYGLLPYCVFWVISTRLSFCADVSELNSSSIFIGVESTLNAYEDETASKFRNVGTKSPDAGSSPKDTNGIQHTAKV